MSRLASFRGPSTPTKSPVPQSKQQHYQNQRKLTPSSPSKQIESTYHRKLRTCLRELRSVAETWEDLVILDGLKSLKRLVDTRTDLEYRFDLFSLVYHLRTSNRLARTPLRLPRAAIVAPKLEVMDQCIADLNTTIGKLRKQFQKLCSIVENIEAILVEAHKTKGWQWVSEEPLWVTWPLEKFVVAMAGIVIPYRRSLDSHIEIVNTLRSHSAPFEESQEAVDKWLAQPYLQEDSWVTTWEDVCSCEVERWEEV